MSPRKALALVARDNRKKDLLEWARYNRESLSEHNLYGTGTTGMIAEDLDLGLTACSPARSAATSRWAQ